MTKATLTLLLLASGALAQDDFSATLKNGVATLRSGALTCSVSKWSPALAIGTDAIQPVAAIKPEEFKLVVDAQDRKALAWIGAPELKGGNLTQFTCVYEIRRGVAAVFVSSRLYNREDAMAAKCTLAWGFRAKDKSFESAGGTATLAGAAQKLAVKEWALFHKPGESEGLCLVTDGLDQIQRKFSSNSSPAQWDAPATRNQVWMSLAANEPDDGLHGTTGAGRAVWKIAPGDYNELNFVAFHAKDKMDAAARFKRLTADPALAKLWRY